MNGTLTKISLYLILHRSWSSQINICFNVPVNSKATKIYSTFENIMGDELVNNYDSELKNVKYSDCMSIKQRNLNLLCKMRAPYVVVGPLDKIKWKQVYKGFNEFSPNINDKDEIKLIKMDPGTSVPLHSHGGREYILVLKGSFCDEYGNYSKGDIQINDQKIKHTPIACKDEGCICLSITENDVIFYGKYGSFLNLFTFIKSFFK